MGGNSQRKKGERKREREVLDETRDRSVSPYSRTQVAAACPEAAGTGWTNSARTPRERERGRETERESE